MISRKYFFSIICVEGIKTGANVQTYKGFVKQNGLLPRPEKCYCQILEDAASHLHCEKSSLVVLAFNKV